MPKKMSDTTKKYKSLSLLFLSLSILVLAAPLVYYVIAAFVQGDVGEKATMGVTVVVAAAMFIANILFKFHIRSTLWVLVLGIYMCLDSIQVLLICVAVGTILDEFILTPLHKKYKSKGEINLEIDRRM